MFVYKSKLLLLLCDYLALHCHMRIVLEIHHFMLLMELLELLLVLLSQFLLSL